MNQTNINRFEESYTKLKDSIDDELNLGNIIKFITRTIETVEFYKELNGLEKKDLVLRLMKQLIKELITNDELEKELLKYMDMIAPGVIDVIIMASKGKLNINFKKICNFNLCCCTSKKNL
jgi:hypothetical protein